MPRLVPFRLKESVADAVRSPLILHPQRGWVFDDCHFFAEVVKGILWVKVTGKVHNAEPVKDSSEH